MAFFSGAPNLTWVQASKNPHRPRQAGYRLLIVPLALAQDRKYGRSLGRAAVFPTAGCDRYYYKKHITSTWRLLINCIPGPPPYVINNIASHSLHTNKVGTSIYYEARSGYVFVGLNYWAFSPSFSNLTRREWEECEEHCQRTELFGFGIFC